MNPLKLREVCAAFLKDTVVGQQVSTDTKKKITNGIEGHESYECAAAIVELLTDVVYARDNTGNRIHSKGALLVDTTVHYLFRESRV